jgi:hypothetical protein
VDPSTSPQPSSPEPAPTPTETPTPTPTVDTTPRWPLTGKPFKDGDEAKARHMAVAVKVPVEMRSFPQSGVDKADIVFWEAQGKSYDITRLCAIFHSKWPTEGANPVRSVRPVDVALISPLKPVLACASATPWVIKYVKKNKKYIELREKLGDKSARWGYKNLGTWWLGSGVSDKLIIAYPKQLSADGTLSKDEIPPVYFPYHAPDGEPSTVNGLPVTQVTLQYKGSKAPATASAGDGKEQHRYTYDAENNNWPASINFQHIKYKKWRKYTVRNGTRVAPDNVLILFCNWSMGVLKGYKGHVEPIYEIIDGSDKFIYIHGGKYVTGTWTKGKITDLFTFTLDDGTPLQMAPGKTWVEMPNGTTKMTIADGKMSIK